MILGNLYDSAYDIQEKPYLNTDLCITLLALIKGKIRKDNVKYNLVNNAFTNDMENILMIQNNIRKKNGIAKKDFIDIFTEQYFNTRFNKPNWFENYNFYLEALEFDTYYFIYKNLLLLLVNLLSKSGKNKIIWKQFDISSYLINFEARCKSFINSHIEP